MDRKKYLVVANISLSWYVERTKFRSSGGDGMVCEYPTGDQTETDLVSALGSVSGPFCVKNKLIPNNYLKKAENLFNTSTIVALNIPELLAECEQSAFGRGTETVLDPSVRMSSEMPASKLNAQTLKLVADTMYVTELAPSLDLELRPYKLVVYQEGGHFDAHRDTVRGDGHIGTLVLILNSEYTGGELEITHNGQTEVVTGPYSWVAMYGDCLHKINPVTSGTRVSLIFDIYARGIYEYYSFWEENRVPKESNILGVSHCNRIAILEGVDKELTQYETLVICLGHKYPLCQAVPEFLKGGDQALYELLKDVYDVQVVACTVNATDDGEGQEVAASMFTSFATTATHDINDAPPPAKRPNTTPRTKFLIPAPINPHNVLDYSPYIDHTGNESQDGATVYLVSGLQLRRRVL